MRAVVELTVTALEQEDIGVDRVTRVSYSAAAPLSDIRTAMARCVGTVILCIPQLLVSEGSWREGTEEEKRIAGLRLPTPWNQIEAGIAAGLGLPTLVVGVACSEGGILDVPSDGAISRGLISRIRGILPRCVPQFGPGRSIYPSDRQRTVLVRRCSQADSLASKMVISSRRSLPTSRVPGTPFQPLADGFDFGWRVTISIHSGR